MRPTSAACLLILLCSGCTTSLINQRVLNEFTDALQEDNEAAFRRITSTRFEQTAMRSETAFRDLEILNLPTGKLTIVESEVIDDTTRSVVVTEDDEEKYQVRLVYDKTKRRWAVDDVMLRQDGKGGTRSTRSATEVMDLLLTLREFLTTLKSADREQILAMTDTELREPLASLPQEWLQTLFSRVTSEYESEMVRRPEAQLNGSEAVVKLPARNGFMLLQIVRRDDQWLIRNVEVHNRREENHPGSVRNQAVALSTVAEFLRAYNADNREALQSLTTQPFYDSSLRIGDFRTLPLPDPDQTVSDFSVRSFAGQFTLLLPVDDEMYRFDLAAADGSDPTNVSATTPAAESSKYVVRDLTVYDRRTNHQRTLSSTFTAPVRAALFMKALHEQDLTVLRSLSTQQLSAATWARLTPDLFALISLAGVPAGETALTATRVTGGVTELQLAAASGQLLRVSMEEEAGGLSVSDVTFPHPTAGIVSLKQLVTLQVPIASLALAWQQQDRGEVQRSCSMDFNRLVWSNVDQLPQMFAQVPMMLLSPIEGFHVKEDRAEVRLATGPQSRVLVRLLKEHNAWVVDEVTLPGMNGQHVNIRESLRSSIAQNILHAPKGTIQMVGHIEVQPTNSPRIMKHSGNAVTTDERPRGNFTVPPLPRPLPRPAAPAATHEPQSDLPEREHDVNRAIYRETAPDGDQVLRFGPNNGQQQSTTAAMHSASDPDNALQPRAAAPPKTAPAIPMTEIDGVTYFGAVPPASQPAPPQPTADTVDEAMVPPLTPAVTPPRSVPRISDPSLYPIDTSRN